MTFLYNSFIIHKTRKPLLSVMTNNITTKNYNPIIGSNLGIPLNILQFIFTTEYFNQNVIY